MELQSLQLHRRTGGLGTTQRGRVGKLGPQSHTATPEITGVLPAPLGVSPLPRHLLQPRCAPRRFKPCRDARGSPEHAMCQGKERDGCALPALLSVGLHFSALLPSPWWHFPQRESSGTPLGLFHLPVLLELRKGSQNHQRRTETVQSSKKTELKNIQRTSPNPQHASLHPHTQTPLMCQYSGPFHTIIPNLSKTNTLPVVYPLMRC